MIKPPRGRSGRSLAIIATIVLIVGILVWINRRDDEQSATTTPSSEVTNQEPVVAAATTTHASNTPDDATTATYVGITTGYGTIVIELYANSAPKTVTNFVTLAKRGYYNNLTFHRVVKDFVIQGGDPKGDGSGGESIYGPTFNDEINAVSLGLSTDLIAQYQARGYEYRSDLTSHNMEVGSVAMANRGPNTNGSQFFIVTGAIPEPGLDGRHTVFGKVVAGMDVVMKINGVETSGRQLDHPKEAVIMTSVQPGDTIDEVMKPAS